MTLLNTRSATALGKWLLLSLGIAALVLAGCSGDTGKKGPEGPTGIPGPPGPPAGGYSPIATAKEIVASIAFVSLAADGKVQVDVRLANELGQPLAGLPAQNIRFVLARLEPGVNNSPSTWHAITRRVEAFPGTPAPQPAQYVTGTGPASQGYTETATSGVWVDNKNGSYSYKFAQSLTSDQAIPYNGNLTHRVGLEIRTSPNITTTNIPANNAVYDWTPALGTRTAIADSGRQIVDDDTCNACHDNLEIHGAARFNLDYCQMCHESYSTDAQSGNSLDLKVMIHKIHAGENLPSVKAGGFYGIFGFGNFFQPFDEVVYPQDLRNCGTCHQEDDPGTPQAGNWRITVNGTTCSSCHDDVNFTTGKNHGSPGAAATEDQCVTCHGQNSSFENLKTANAHVIPEQVAAQKFKYEILSVVDTAPGQKPTVTMRVVDPTNGNQPYDIKSPTSPFQGDSNASLAVDLGYSTRPDFTNTGSGSATATTGTPAQPIRLDFKANAVPDPATAGAFKVTSAIAIPLGTTGSGAALVEGRPTVDVNGDGTRERIPVASVSKTFKITDPAPVPYRQVVNITKCNDCHAQLSLHGNGRTDNTDLCATCHNPNATDINRRVAGSNCEAVTGTLNDQTIDFKVMVHAIHAGPVAQYKVCGYNNTGYDFSYVIYPGRLNNCEGCHLPTTYYPPNPAIALSTTVDAAPATAPSRASPAGDIATTPGTAVCSACHVSQAAKAHMQQSGGSFNAVKAADSTTPAAALESCGTCHGPGSASDVKVVHGVGEFNYN
jgi:OmcA/MtrC family decaheme c-type cytochrome